MGNYEQLKQSVSDVIKTNGNQEITGSILQNVLLTIISTVGANATFAGIATPTTNPGTPDGHVFYLASENGTYSNFGSIELQDGLSVLIWNGSWSSQQILSIDDEPTVGSNNLVKSGGIKAAIDCVFGSNAIIVDGTLTISSQVGAHTLVQCKPGDKIKVTLPLTWSHELWNYSYLFAISNSASSYTNDVAAVLNIANLKQYYEFIALDTAFDIFVRADAGTQVQFNVINYSRTIAKNAQDIAKNAQDIAQNAQDIAQNAQDISMMQEELNGDEEIINLRNIDGGINISSASSFPITRNMWSNGWDDKNVLGNTKYNIRTLVTINDKDKITVSSLTYKIRQFDVNGNTISPDAEYTTSFDQNSDIEFVTDTNAKKIRMWSAMVVSDCSSSEEILFKMDLQASIVHPLILGLVDKVNSNTQDIAELEHDLNELVSSIDSYTLIGHLTETDKSGTRLEFPIIPNKEYILHMPSESWDITGYTTSYIFMLGYVDDNGVSHDWRGFTNFNSMPSFEGLEFSFNASKAFLFCRAANGVEVTFGIEYKIDNEYLKGIAKNSQDIDSMQEDISQNTQDISGIQEELIAFNGKAFYSGEKISINQLYYKIYGGLKHTNSYAQGLDTYKDYLVYAENGGYIHIFNAKTLAQITEYQLATDSHCAEICFGTVKYDANDTFPLMYAAKGNAMVELLRISLDGTSSIVQTITLTKPSGVEYVEGAVCIDYDRNKMYALGTTLSNIQTIPNNEYVIIEYDIPNISKSIVTLQPNRILAQWSYPQYTPSGDNDYPNPQGICYNSGKVFLSVGRNTIESNRMYVIDVESGTVVNDIRIGRDVYLTEPEGCTIYNGMYYCIAVNNVLYSVRF